MPFGHFNPMNMVFEKKKTEPFRGDHTDSSAETSSPLQSFRILSQR